MGKHELNTISYEVHSERKVSFTSSSSGVSSSYVPSMKLVSSPNALFSKIIRNISFNKSSSSEPVNPGPPCDLKPPTISKSQWGLQSESSNLQYLIKQHSKKYTKKEIKSNNTRDKDSNGSSDSSS